MMVGNPEKHQSLVLDLLAVESVLTMDELVLRLPSLSWSSVFYAVDTLSRRGAIILRRRGYQYEISSSALSATGSGRGVCVASPQM
jgi:hypothetical protein